MWNDSSRRYLDTVEVTDSSSVGPTIEPPELLNYLVKEFT